MAETIPTARLEEIRELAAAKDLPRGPYVAGDGGFLYAASGQVLAEFGITNEGDALLNLLEDLDPQTISAIVSELIERRNKDKANG